MGELRFEELRGEWVDYAIHRQERTFLPTEEHCPLCPTRPGGAGGLETEIPVPEFEIAVFENRFPAFESPRGAAEVVVYTDSHHGSFATLPPERARALMWVWRQRYAELGAREDVQYVLIFENRGVEVGVTLHHPHGQIYAYPFLPPVPAAERAADERLGGCALCALLRRELQEGSRVVYENGDVLVYVPYAARWSFEAHAVLRAHRPSLQECTPVELDSLAAALQALTRGYDALFERPFPYIMAVHQAPTGAHRADRPHLGAEGRAGGVAGRAGGVAGRAGGVAGRAGGVAGRAGGVAERTGGADAGDAPCADPDPVPLREHDGHLHVEFYPPLRTPEKLKYLAGSEQGGGVFIADTLPEESAGALREAIDRAA